MYWYYGHIDKFIGPMAIMKDAKSIVRTFFGMFVYIQICHCLLFINSQIQKDHKVSHISHTNVCKKYAAKICAKKKHHKRDLLLSTTIIIIIMYYICIPFRAM